MIKIKGTIFGSSGYASHTRSLAKALNKLVPVKLETDLFSGCETQLDDETLKMLKQEDYKVNLFISLPTTWKLFIEPNKVNIGFLIFEGDRIPGSWLNECLNPKIDYIFVASSHTSNAIINSLDSLSEDECKILLEKLKC